MYPIPTFLNSVERLSWPRFLSGAYQDELICTTDNFFVISGYGAFVPGYILIVAKQPYRSLSVLNDSNYHELKWLTELMTRLVSKCYGKPVALFEHGMCGCTDSDNAHLHIFPISCQVTAEDVKAAIDRVLDNRGIGITDEIDQALRRPFRSAKSNQEVWTFEHMPKLSIDSYPQQCRTLHNYIYFRTPFSDASFLTDANFGSQVGREIVFELENKCNIELKEMNPRFENNQGKLLWRWQDFMFEENVLKTRSNLLKFVENLDEFGIEKRFSLMSSS